MPIRKRVDAWLRQFEKEFIVQNRIEVSKSALLHNADLFAERTGKAVIPVLKGNAYGHGIQLVAEALKSRRFPYIAVDGYYEALRIREVSKQPVLIMGAIRPENFAKLKYDHFSFVVQDAAAVEMLARTRKRLKVHLECNTGMNRYGARMSEIEMLTKQILSHKNLTLEGVMSHLADSDGEQGDTVSKAVQMFDQCVEIVRAAGAEPTMFHVGQSAGSLREQSKYSNTIRLGLSLYGLNPFPEEHAGHAKLRDLKPVLRFVSTITKITDLKQGDKVSYNYTFTAPKAMKIAVLPIGYYEGLNRELSNRGLVKLGKQYCPIVGRICMNHTMIGLGGVSAKIGDEVVVYSNDPKDSNSIDAMARDYGLFKYTFLTSLSTDIRRQLVA